MLRTAGSVCYIFYYFKTFVVTKHNCNCVYFASMKRHPTLQIALPHPTYHSATPYIEAT